MDQVQCARRGASRGRFLFVVFFALVVVLLGACSNIEPAATSATRPAAMSPTTAAAAQPQPAVPPVSASPAASPKSGRPFRVPDALLAPADLSFNAAYPAAGWHRCDDYALAKSLQDFRLKYKVVESAAAIWEYGSKCGAADQKARLDEYAWRLPNEDAVLKLSGYLADTSYFDQLTPELRKQVREFQRDAMLVRSSPVESNGKKQFVAEVIGQAGLDVAYMRMTTEKTLTDEEYLALARSSLDRLRAGEAAK
jgi:hypothetical protein